MQVEGVGAATRGGLAGGAAQPRLVHAAHEFEGQMLKELLKPMTRSDGLTGEDDGSDANSNGVLGEFASQALGQALSERGGFGIAHQILGQISSSGNHSGTTAVTGSSHVNTGMRTHK